MTDYLQIILEGTKGEKAKSDGFCTRIKKGTCNGYGLQNNYGTEKALARLTIFEKLLLGSLGLSMTEITFIIENTKFDTKVFKWGYSNKLIECKFLGSGASKKAYQIKEYGTNGNGFIIKYNYETCMKQVKNEVITYEKLILSQKLELVSKIYKYLPLTKTENAITIKNINGEQNGLTIDGIIFGEYCSQIGLHAPTDELKKEFCDMHTNNVGLNSNGKIVAIDYGIIG